MSGEMNDDDEYNQGYRDGWADNKEGYPPAYDEYDCSPIRED